MTEKETAVKERTLKECLKETWYQTDVKTYNDLNGSKQRERKGYRCAETMDLPRVLYDGEGFLFYMLSSERAAT